MLNELRVLDLFCGMGGWSIPFIEDRDEVVGIDIKNQGYPGELIIQDIRTLDGSKFQGFDLIIGSPPCTDFTTASQANKSRYGRKPPNPARGMRLVEEFNRIIKEANPKYWAMENVARLSKFYPRKPIWHFMMSVRGHRLLWGNIPLGLTPHYISHKRMEGPEFTHKGFDEASKLRSKIPYPIACIIRDTIHLVTEP